MKPMKRKGKSNGQPLNHKCSIYGCNNIKTHLYCRSDSQAGGIYLCDACADEIADLLDDVGVADVDVETVIAGFEDMYPEYKVVRADSVADPETMTVQKLIELYPHLEILEGHADPVGDTGDPGVISLTAETITLTGEVDFETGDGSAENPFKTLPAPIEDAEKAVEPKELPKTATKSKAKKE